MPIIPLVRLILSQFPQGIHESLESRTDVLDGSVFPIRTIFNVTRVSSSPATGGMFGTPFITIILMITIPALISRTATGIISAPHRRFTRELFPPLVVPVAASVIRGLPSASEKSAIVLLKLVVRSRTPLPPP